MPVTVSDQFNGYLTPRGDVQPRHHLSPSGRMIGTVSKFETGSITPTGALVNSRVMFPLGAVAPAGALLDGLTKLHAGGLAPAGALQSAITQFLSGTVAPNATLSAGIGEAPCNIFLSELKQRTADLLEDPGMIYYTPAEIRHGLNVMQRLFCLITFCVERTVSFPLVNGQTYYEIDSVIADFICPLRVTFSGARLRPMTLHSLNMLSGTWRLTPGSPTHYAQEGFNGLWVYKQPAGGVNSLSVTYAAEPSEMVADSDFPEIAPEHQIFLPDGAMWYLRLKEGGLELQYAVKYLQRFLENAQAYEHFVRARSKAQGYDPYPRDLSTFEKARFEFKLKNQPQAKQQIQGTVQ